MTPVTYDNLVCGHRWAVKWGPFYQGDLLETAILVDVLKKEKIEAVFHFAAFAEVGESVRNPIKYYMNNVVGTLSLLEAMGQANVRKLVFSSTCATYGIPKDIPIAETATQNPINPYGHSKLMVEKILKDVSQSRGISITALRYFNAGGADASAEIGEDHDPESHLIPITLDAARKRRENLAIFGEDYETKDGTCIRDYIHVTDLAEAHVLAFETMSKPEFRAYNLGTGQGVSVRQVIQMVEKVTGLKVPVQSGTRRPGDPPCLVASGEKAKAELGWRPQHSSLENIVATAAAWHEKHFLSAH
jgi:UDP-glucose-4-epimerase GalE